MAELNEVKLGDIAKDSISGFKGVVVAITKWIHGCNRITLQPQGLLKGKRLENDTFDEPQIEVLKKKTHKTTSGTGGWAPAPVEKSSPRRI